MQTPDFCMFLTKYCKSPKFSDIRNIAVMYLKFKQRGQTLRVFCQSGANEIANSEDPDQTAPLSVQFAQFYLSAKT